MFLQPEALRVISTMTSIKTPIPTHPLHHTPVAALHHGNMPAKAAHPASSVQKKPSACVARQTQGHCRPCSGQVLDRRASPTCVTHKKRTVLHPTGEWQSPAGACRPAPTPPAHPALPCVRTLSRMLAGAVPQWSTPPVDWGTRVGGFATQIYVSDIRRRPGGAWPPVLGRCARQWHSRRCAC